MVRIAVVTRIRFLALIAPLVMLLAAPFIAGGLYVFGGQIDSMRDRELTALRAAREMEVALYQMEWARTQHDRDQILIDQQRAFAHWLDLARDHAETSEQGQIITAIEQDADPLFGLLRSTAPGDENADRMARNLRARISDLIGAGDQVLIDLAAASRRAATRLIVVTLVAAVAIPWLCFAALYAAGGTLKAELRSMRDCAEHLRDRPAAALTADEDFNSIDQSLARLGFPRPDPMLAD